MDSQFSPPGQPAPVVTPQVVYESQTRRPSTSRSALRTLFFVLLVVALGVSLLVNFGLVASRGGTARQQPRLDEKFHSLNQRGSDKVAIIKVEGPILDGDGFVKRQIDEVREDSGVKAVVLRVDSPGGTVTGSDYMYHHLRSLAKERDIPIVVSMGSLAASGGYYVAMAVGNTPNSIYAEPTTWTGSIGVIIPHYNFAGLMDEWSIEEDSVKSHPLKSMGSPTRKMTDEERAIFEGLVHDSFEGFKDIVRSGRPALRDKPEALERIATGQVFTTQQALDNGLVDRRGFIEDAIERAIELAELKKEDVRVVEYAPQVGLLNEMLFGPQSHVASQATQWSMLAKLAELSTPRAYYLFTWPTASIIAGRD